MPTEGIRKLRIMRRELAAESVLALELRSADGWELPAWEPGAHIDVHLGTDLVRQYSLCGDPAERETWNIAVLRDPQTRGGSAHVHESLREGDVVEVGTPRNRFPLLPARRYVFIAGGIGITPLLPMMAAADARGIEWELHYGGRSLASMAFLSRIAGWGDRATLYPFDTVGLIDLDTVLRNPQDGTLVYCCGPEALLAATERQCAAWPADALRVERFSARPDVHEAVRHPFDVTLARRQRTVHVPAHRSLLDVLHEAGIAVPSSCGEGTCGTCETVVLAGEVDHRDSLLSPAERAANDTMFICVSRAAGPPLLLDL